MPPLTKQQLDQVKYVSIQDYCQKVDRIESLEDKLAFSTRYILTYNGIKNGEADPDLEKLIKVAHMKIADKSADIKLFYQETQANKNEGEKMVDPNVEVYANDMGNQMFIADPVGYLKGKAKELQAEMKAKSWKSEYDIQTMISTASLLNDVFTDQLGNKIAKDIKKPTVFDVNVRLENAFGGPAALKKAYEDTKPSLLSRMFDTSSLAAKNLDTAYKAFNNPNHALHGSLPTVQKAATEYLQHVLPDYKPNDLRNIPSLQDINGLSGTRKARALLSINLLNAVKQQKDMEVDYDGMVASCQGKNLSYDEIPPFKLSTSDKENEKLFQAEVEKSVKSEEKDDKEIMNMLKQSDNEIEADKDSVELE